MAKLTIDTLPAERSRQATVEAHEPTYAEVQTRAYYRYIDRGRIDGFDREDWRLAEAELRGDHPLILPPGM
jgi:hypothetical protein